MSLKARGEVPDMPELPEVETIRRDLSDLLTGKSIQKIEVPDPTVLTGIGPGGKPRWKVVPAQFERNVIGKKIARFDRRGKYLVMEFEDLTSIIFHLRMTGQLRVEDPSGRERLVLAFDRGVQLCFRDTRRFGEARYSAEWKAEKDILALGIEPLDGKMTAGDLRNFFRNRTAPIHSLLLNQSLIAGLGNIYVTEALFRARILPFRQAGRISENRLEALALNIRKVLEESVRNRGYSMKNYVDALGRKGRSQLFTLAYGKDGQPCRFCKEPLRRKSLSGRGVVYCAQCQK